MGRMVSVVALGASLALEGWYHYLDRDLRKLLGMKIKAPLRVAELEAEQGAPDADAMAGRRNRRADLVRSGPPALHAALYHRPSGIQQVISLRSHR